MTSPDKLFRERVFGGWVTYNASALLDAAPPGSPTTQPTGLGYRSVDYSHMTGWNTPNFHKRVKAGELMPFTPFTQFSITGQGINEWDLTPTTWPASGTREYTVGNGIVLQEWFADLEPALLSRAGTYSADTYVQAAAARLAAGSFDALTFLSELRKTVDMFVKLGTKLLKIITDPKVNWAQIVASWKSHGSKNAADQWLVERYGWRTLIFDIEDFNDALQNLESERKRRKERTGFKNTFSRTDTTFASDAKRDIRRDTLHEYSVSVRGSVVADIEPTRFQFNPLTTGWELIRFSFVIDWFLSVGAALGALSFLVLNSNYTAAGGVEIIDKCTFTQTTTPKSGFTLVSSNASVTSTSKLQVRTPCRVTTLPQFRLRLDVTKVIDLMALVVQAFARRK